MTIQTATQTATQTAIQTTSPKGYVKFSDINGTRLQFVSATESRVLCWKETYRGSNGDFDKELWNICIQEVGEKSLKVLNLWDDLSESQQASVQFTATVNEENKENESGKPKRGRKPRADSAHLPRNITCSKCLTPTYMAPCVLIKKVGLEDLSIEEQSAKLIKWLPTYECSTCSPRRRGRQANPLYVGIPKTATCKCGKESLMAAASLYEKFDGDIDKIKDYCANYLCRKCNPDWGSWLKGKKRKSSKAAKAVKVAKVAKKTGGQRGRKTLPENVGFPKKAICTVCSKAVGIVPNQIREKAQLMGITVEELFAGYKCRSCGGVVRKNKTNKTNQTNKTNKTNKKA